MTVFSISIHFASPHDGKWIPDWAKFRRSVETADDLTPQQLDSANWLIGIHSHEVGASTVWENRHIVPKSLEGHHTHPSNLVRLSPGNHFVVHVHLCIVFPGYHQLRCTVAMMAGGDRNTRTWNLTTYHTLLENESLIAAVEEARISHRENMRGNRYSTGNPGEWRNGNRNSTGNPGGWRNGTSNGTGNPGGWRNGNRNGTGNRLPPSSDPRIERKRQSARESYYRCKARKRAAEGSDIRNLF